MHTRATLVAVFCLTATLVAASGKPATAPNVQLLPSVLSEAQEAWLLAVAHNSRPASLPFPAPNVSQLTGLDVRAAAHEQQLRNSNLRHGHIVDVLFNSTAANRKTMAYDTVGDSATWTGHFLAAQAMRAAYSQGAADTVMNCPESFCREFDGKFCAIYHGATFKNSQPRVPIIPHRLYLPSQNLSCK